MSIPHVRVSWSSLKRWEDCHRHQQLVMAGRRSAGQNGRVFLSGTVADRTMREWLEQDDPQPGQMADMVGDIFRRYAHPETPEERAEAQYVVKWKGNPAQDQQNALDFAREVVLELEPILVREVLPYEWLGELKFTTTVGLPHPLGGTAGVDLIGGIDIVVRTHRDPDRYKLFDLKATKSPEYMAKTLGQSIFYDLAFGGWIGDASQPEAFGFISPALEQKIHWTAISDDDRRIMLDRIVKYAHGMWAEQFETKPVPDSGCRWCDTNHACSLVSPTVYRDAVGRARASFALSARQRRVQEKEGDPKED